MPASPPSNQRRAVKSPPSNQRRAVKSPPGARATTAVRKRAPKLAENPSTESAVGHGTPAASASPPDQRKPICRRRVCWALLSIVAGAVVLSVLAGYVVRVTSDTTSVTNHTSSPVYCAMVVAPLLSSFTPYEILEGKVTLVTDTQAKPGETVVLYNGGIRLFYQRFLLVAPDKDTLFATLGAVRSVQDVDFDSHVPGRANWYMAELNTSWHAVVPPEDLFFEALAPPGLTHPRGLAVLDPVQENIYTSAVRSTTDVVVERTNALRRTIIDRWQGDSVGSSATHTRYSSDPIPPKLAQFLERRRANAEPALRSFLGVDTAATGAKIALAGSGGGFRAMVGFTGFLRGAERIGLLNATTYVAGVSGSTWALAHLFAFAATSMDVSFSNVVEMAAVELRRRVNGNDMSRPIPFGTLEGAQWAIERVLERHFAGTGLSLVDLYGMHISHYLLQDGGNDLVRAVLSQQQTAILNGTLPLPIYTSVVREPPVGHQAEGQEGTSAAGVFEWIQFDPFEVGAGGKGVFVPAVGFGRQYEGGESVKREDGLYPSEVPLGLLAGIFGSAFCATIQLIFEEVELIIPPALAETVRIYLNDQPDIASLHAIPPASFPNFLKNVELSDPSGLTTMDRLHLMDAGIAFNIPVPPLLHEPHRSDVIVVFDASVYGGQNEMIGRELQHAENYARERGLAFPTIEYEGISTRSASVFDGDCISRVPTVVFFPLIQIENGEFDPQANAASGGFTSTFNFLYTSENFDTLSNHAEDLLVRNKAVVQDAVRRWTESCAK